MKPIKKSAINGSAPKSPDISPISKSPPGAASIPSEKSVALTLELASKSQKHKNGASIETKPV